MSVDSAVKHLMDREKYTESGSRIRVSNARLIIRDGQLYDALKLVSLSKRVHSRWTDRARALLAINK